MKTLLKYLTISFLSMVGVTAILAGIILTQKADEYFGLTIAQTTGPTGVIAILYVIVVVSATIGGLCAAFKWSYLPPYVDRFWRRAL